MGTEAGPQPPHSQTLDRGIRVLELLAETGGPHTITELATALGVHRSIVYRILRTLEDHRLVARAADGRIELGVGLSALARSVSRDLSAAALPELAAAANELGLTCFLAVADGEECVTLLSVAPRHSLAHISYRPGTKHPLTSGAPGVAILAARPPTANERAAVAAARVLGYARSTSEVIDGLSSIAVPLPSRAAPDASLATLFVGEQDETALAHRLNIAAAAIAAELG